MATTRSRRPTDRTPGPCLYARVLGSSWNEVAEPIRVVHGSEPALRAHGNLQIAHGRNQVAGLMARWLRLPRESDAAETRLSIMPGIDDERWCRTFDDRRMDSRQYQTDDGELAERYGPLEFRFHLETSGGSLLFRQLGVALLLGSIRLPLPAVCAPHVEAREDSTATRQVHLHVRIAMPGVGPLLTYDGNLDVGGRCT